MEIEFESLEELYKRIRPALHCKVLEMRREGYIYIKEEDIWNFFKEKKWVNSKDLSLYQMVSDVLNVDNILVDKYLKEKLNMRNRVIYFEGKGEEND